MALALERLGQKLEADSLLDNLEKFARSQLESKYTDVRAEASYLLALVLKKKGEKEEPRQLLEKAINLRPDLLGPRFELRGDVLDPLPQYRVGGGLTAPVLSHHRTYGSVYGGS
jgi:tetratricopeptide (TPR) repeat protein